MKLPVPVTSRLAVLVALLLAILSSPSFGQDNGSNLLVEQRAAIAEITRRTDDLELRMRSNLYDDAALVEVRNHLEEQARRLIASGVAFRPRLAAINNRLDEIGPAPGEGSPPEPAALTEERQSLLNEKAEINTLLGDAEKLSLRANKMIEEIAQIRRDLFSNTLSRRYDLSTALSPRVLGEFAAESSKLYQALSSWVRFAVNYKLSSVLLATFFALLAAAVLLFGGRRLFGNLIEADPENEEPSYLTRLSVAFWSTLLPSAALAVFLFATHFFFNYFGVLRHDIAQLMVSFFNVIAIVFFVYRLASAVFSPNLPEWRLVPVEPRAARVLFWLVWLTALVASADFFLSRVNVVMSSPLSLTIAKSLVATVIVGVLVILIATVKPYIGYDGRPRRWGTLFRVLLFGLGGTTVLAALLGYIGFARFMSQQIVITGAILATMYIGYLSASAISELGAFGKTALGRRLTARFHFDETTEDQLGLAASVVIDILILAVGIPLILLQWGFQWGDMRAWTYNFATEVRIGSISISLIGILTGVLVFVIGYFLTRGFQHWLDGKVMARGRVDAGVRNSISTAVGYAGVALAGLIGISAAGIDLSSLALIAGALSLGIGFGLQNVVSNFVSGLILLAERPFKVGDWIVAGAVTGTVKKISVRATEIETFQKQTVILPNSELINSAVGNWTHRNKLGRTEIRVGVPYGSDVRKVHQLLTDIIASHPLALRNPEPFVAFTNFGTNFLEFEARLFLADINTQGSVGNEIRFQIIEVFGREGIEIAYTAPPATAKPAPPKRRRSRRDAVPE
ncbi:mechanosensitive ion channel family protein [Aquamicrobium sp. LC103]|uniref:mechanosensitive ion channel family protein n=1 Tax=Aquamicrobium sp. LC103 TaxID=1120658 RepID=UPI000699897A|nr:mechanosensitive ion channel family protein [Aquamicrobium sp. LC103]TKT80064.1 mechanosensitive ion channel family protein [Aquamicrobium sp. LC103]